MHKIEIGATHTISIVADEKFSARAYGSGDVDVYATPAMILHMEMAAAAAVKPALDAGFATVGTRVDIEHMAASPMGANIRAIATLRQIEGRRLIFDVSAHDNTEQIGRGTHERFIIDTAKFMQRVENKIKEK